MILVLSGTKDGRNIVAVLKQAGYSVMATTFSAYGAQLLLQQDEGIPVIDGGLDDFELERLIEEKRIDVVVDATHPFAVEVTKMALNVTARLRVPYIRYEREGTELPDGGVYTAETFEEAAEKAGAYQGNVFLTVGSRHLETFCHAISPQRIIARVLPQSEIIKKCEKLGLKPCNIVAIQGPFSKELNKELYSHYRTGVVVTKDSGKTGGTEEKIEAAEELSIPVIMVARPKMDYPLVALNTEQLLLTVSLFF